ncbi:MAG: right-handed parallel beta-helix repeat-containing protein [Phycisphaerales bacterium]
MTPAVRTPGALALAVAFLTGLISGQDAAAQRVVSYPDEPVRIHVYPQDDLDGIRDRVRSRLAEQPQQLIEVVLHEGVYRLDEPLVLDARDGASGWGAVVWTAAEDAHVVINGAAEITGWTPSDDGAWEADVSNWPHDGFRELFVNGERRPRARHPNSGFLRVSKAGSDRRSYFYFDAGALDTAREAGGQELVFLHDWTITRLPVADIDRRQRILTPIAPIGNTLPMFFIDNWEPNPRYYLENDPGFLDAPGEWWIDPQRRVVRYRPMAGETVEQARFEAPVADRLLEIRGEPGNPVTNLHFRDIHFSFCRWEPLEMGYFGIQATAFEPNRRGLPPGWVPAAIHVNLAENVTFEGGSIAHTGTGGIWLRSRVRDCAVRGMHVHDTAGNGIAVGEGAGGRWIDGVAWEVARPEEAATGNAIEDNLVERVGQVYYGSVGIWAGLTVRTSIAHNTIRNMPYSGISLGWKWSLEPTPACENRIAHNHIHDVMQVLSDGAGVYTLGRQPGTVIEGNHIHGVPENAGRAENNGMFFDEGSMHILVRDNIVYDVGRAPLRWNMAGPHTVTQNTLVHRPEVPLYKTRRMAEGSITWKANTRIEAENWSPPDGALPQAGPRVPYRDRLPLVAGPGDR